MDKQELLDAVIGELEDRTDEQELAGLRKLLELVQLEQPMSFAQYEWLSYLVAARREMKLREELE